MSDATDKTIALNVRLKPGEPSAHPRATNYTNVGVAQAVEHEIEQAAENSVGTPGRALSVWLSGLSCLSG